MYDPIYLQNILCIVDPVLWVRHIDCSWNRNRTLFRYIILNFSRTIFYEPVNTFRSKSSRICDSRNLCSQKMFFFSKKVWISYDLPFKIACKFNFSNPCCFNIFSIQIRQKYPWIQRRICSPISVFIDSRSSRLEI